MVVLMTGVGVRLLIEVVEPVYGRADVRACAGPHSDRRARSQARGRASRARVDVVGYGAQPEHVAGASGHAGCSVGEAPLDGVRVAVQEVRARESRIGARADGARRRSDPGADLQVVDA